MRRLIFILCAMIGVSQAQTIQYIGAPTTTVISRGNFRTDSIFYLPKRSKAPTDTAALRYQISDSSLYVWSGSQWIKAGGSGTIFGSGITGYLPQFSASTTLDTSALFTLGNRLGVGTSSFVYNTTSTANVELNGTAGGILGFKRNDSARGYLWHTGDNMELANTVAGSISFNTNSATRGSIASDGVWRLHNLAGTGDRVVVASSNGTLSAASSATGLVDTLTISTRAWRQKGLDSLAALEVSGSGTTNYVPKFTAGSTIGNSQIFDNGTNVGIGTASPGVKLDIVGSAGTIVRTKGGTGSSQGSAYYVQLAGSTNTLSAFGDRANIFGGTVDQIASIYTGSGIPLTFDVNAAERLRITSGGDVGIGTASPISSSVLDIVSSTNIYPRIRSTGTGEAFQFYQNSTSGTTAADGLFVGINSGNDAFFYNAEATPARFFTSGTERLRITSAGELLINTTSDAGDYKLQVSGNIYNTGSAVLAATSGEVLVGTTTDRGAYKFQADGLSFFGSDANSYTLLNNTASNAAMQAYGAWTNHLRMTYPAVVDFDFQVTASGELDLKRSSTVATRVNTAREFMINTTTDAGDYHLQVVGNARVGTGKLDIASNTTFGLGVARSGTSEVAGQIYNSSGILYLGAESSAGGQIFTGSSAYAAVIGSGANYPLQFATNNATRATINTNGELLINTLTDNGDFKLQVNGNGYITGNLQINPSANTTGIYMPSMSWTGSNASAAVNVSGTLNTTGAPSLIYVDVSDVASGTETNFMQFVNSDTKFRVTKQGDIQTAAPSGGTARKWKLGSVVATSVQLDTANYVEVEINGTFYRLAIVTPL